jgi:hypothetical protein
VFHPLGERRRTGALPSIMFEIFTNWTRRTTCAITKTIMNTRSVHNQSWLADSYSGGLFRVF